MANEVISEASHARHVGGRSLPDFPLVETGYGATGGGFADGVSGYGRLRSSTSGLHDGGHLDSLRAGEVLRHPDPASVA